MEQAREPASSSGQIQTRVCCGPVFLKRSLLLFWSVWLTVVFLTNAADAAKAAGLLDESWTFASGNFGFVSQTTARYGTPSWANVVMFAGVIFWEGFAALLFWMSGCMYRRVAGRSVRYAAFTVSLLLWAAFMVADEIFIAYAVEGTHLRLFIAQLATLLAVELLPES